MGAVIRILRAFFGVVLIILGSLFLIDSIIPKERSVEFAWLLAEALIGLAILVIGIIVFRRARLFPRG